MDKRIKSIFGDHADSLQVYVDENLEKFKAPFFPNYFSFGTPKGDLSYATAIGRSRIEAAASVVAHGSESPLRGRAGLEKLSGEVAALKVKRKMDESEYRNWMVFQGMPVSDEAKKQQIVRLIWDDVKHVVDSVTSRLDIMVKQALSTGVVAITAATNPDGIAVGNIDMLIAANRNTGIGTAFGGTASQVWTATGAQTIADATPISDIIEMVENMEDQGIAFEKILMTPAKWRAISRVTEVMTAIGGAGNPVSPTLEQFNSYLVDRQLPYIELVVGRHSIETNGNLTVITPWPNARVTFIPAGPLGVIHNALAIEEMTPVAGVSYAVSDRTLVSKWSETEPFGEYTRGEIAAFPGLEAADNLYIVDTETV
jgi:hypothetical protein